MSTIRIQPDAVYVVGVGAQTPVGRNALSAAAAVRCGISAYADHPFMIDKHGEPMVVARAEWLDEVMSVQDRVLQLGLSASLDALAPWIKTGKSLTLNVVLSLSSQNVAQEELRNEIASRFMSGLNAEGISPRCQVVCDGNAAGTQAMLVACQSIRKSPDELCLVVGVDSHLGPEQLDLLDYSGRLHSVNNSWGFTPGEAAGVCLLASGRAVDRFQLKPLAEVQAISMASESKLLGTKTVCIGEGLSSAFRGVLNKDELIHQSYCDLNGETYRADEFAFAVCRTSQYFQDASSFTAAAECWGDVGTASAPLQVVLAASAWARGYAKGPVALAWSSSAHLPLRGAIRLRQCVVSEEK